MRDNSQSNGITRNVIAVLMCAALYFSVLFSAFFIADEYHHDCVGEVCPICQCIAECEAFVNQISSGLIIVFIALLTLAIAADSYRMFVSLFSANTLVTQKVRLNN
jgi:NADH:ubiquinone oxidoreductase subunit K